ncbi:hypothetical protein [Microcystis aeruginosa]|nr:hypothetical protein [Microcystis aeruginosa]MDB9391581.1 hypothetical protein [Microcystis aeruginosa CS-579]
MKSKSAEHGSDQEENSGTFSLKIRQLTTAIRQGVRQAVRRFG